MAAAPRKDLRSAKLTKPGDSYHHGDLKEAFVLAAEGLAEKTGTVDFSLREVAATVGVTHSAAYRHFRDKAALLGEVARRGFSNLEREIRRALEPPMGERPLVAAGTAYVRFAISHPGTFRVMFHASLKPFSDYPELLAAATSALDVLREVLRQLDPDRPEETLRAQTMTTWATIHGLAVLLLERHLEGPFHTTKEAASEATQTAMETLLTGLGQ